jgi:hypothetical protein
MVRSRKFGSGLFTGVVAPAFALFCVPVIASALEVDGVVLPVTVLAGVTDGRLWFEGTEVVPTGFPGLIVLTTEDGWVALPGRTLALLIVLADE